MHLHLLRLLREVSPSSHACMQRERERPGPGGAFSSLARPTEKGRERIGPLHAPSRRPGRILFREETSPSYPS
jgi:hypothetical protein